MEDGAQAAYVGKVRRKAFIKTVYIAGGGESGHFWHSLRL